LSSPDTGRRAALPFARFPFSDNQAKVARVEMSDIYLSKRTLILLIEYRREMAELNQVKCVEDVVCRDRLVLF